MRDAARIGARSVLGRRAMSTAQAVEAAESSPTKQVHGRSGCRGIGRPVMAGELLRSLGDIKK